MARWEFDYNGITACDLLVFKFFTACISLGTDKVADKIYREHSEVNERLKTTVVGVEGKEAGHHYEHLEPIFNVDL